MVIDVQDLNFETLQFSRRYETMRYKRARNIYNDELIKIRIVDRIDDDEYNVLASVEGNYSIYTVKLNIVGNKVRRSSCTCEDYAKGNLCKHIIATSMELIDPHNASTEEGAKKLKEAKKKELQNKLAEIKRQQEEERKKREYERIYRSGLDLINKYTSSVKQQPKYLDVDMLFEETNNEKNNKTGELATSIKLEYIVQGVGADGMEVSFKIGQTRMYILNDIANFYSAYKNEAELYYGKQLRFIPKRENFEPNSQALFDCIIKYAEMRAYREKHGSYIFGYYSGYKVIVLTGNDLDEFMDLNRDKGLNVNTSNRNKAI